ncbi:MAG: hypothetical protein ABL897_00995, partial [Hyphomicrobium sp.]
MRRMTMFTTTVTFAAGLLAGTSFAASAARAAVVAIEGARVVVGDGRVVENATIVFDGAKITQVGVASAVQVPAGATRV